MNIQLKLAVLAVATVTFTGCATSTAQETVVCSDKAPGSKFTHNDMTYLVVNDSSIRYSSNLNKLGAGTLRFCTSHVTDMWDLFDSNATFNQPIGDWDTSNVNDMFGMFTGARAFNQPIGNWDTSKVTDMAMMFTDATSFNQPIGDWDVSKVTDLDFTFKRASSFNQDLSKWDVSNVKLMSETFKDASSFNHSIESWVKQPY